MIHWPNVGLLFAHRLRRWLNSKPRLGQRLIFAGYAVNVCNFFSQENYVKISSRTFQMLCEVYEDALGVDYEKMWQALVEAQNHTG